MIWDAAFGFVALLLLPVLALSGEGEVSEDFSAENNVSFTLEDRMAKAKGGQKAVSFKVGLFTCLSKRKTMNSGLPNSVSASK